MNRLRKIGNWLWLNKERMVLAVMVGFLIFRVYTVVSPAADEKEGQIPPPPTDKIPDDANLPGDPPPPPPPPRLDDWSRLPRFNPFGPYRPVQVGGGGNQETNEQFPLRLLNIREIAPGELRAQIDSGVRSSWYAEGQAFETYEVLDIDPDAGTATVFSEREQQQRILRLENP